MNNLESKMSMKGARPINPIRRKFRKAFRRTKMVRGLGFDWKAGYDVRNKIGEIKRKDQSVNSSCGGQSGAYFLFIQRMLQGIKEGELSAKSIYAPIAYPGGGTTIPSLETQLAARGANLEADVPSYYLTGEPLSEAMMIEKSWRTDKTIADAIRRAGYLPIDIPDDIDSVAEAIQNYGAVIWEIAGQNNGTWSTAYPTPPSKDNTNPIWHHFMCAIGARLINGKKYIVALQSMGDEWGDKGIQYFSEEYFKSGYIIDAFTFGYDAVLSPVSTNHSMWAEVVRWFRAQAWFWAIKSKNIFA